MLEKRNNRDSILTLANLINLLKENNNNNWEKIENIQSLDSNYKFTKEISSFCIDFFENELIESEGLTFMMNYFNKCESLLKDIEYYINKKDWEEYNIEIKKWIISLDKFLSIIGIKIKYENYKFSF